MEGACCRERSIFYVCRLVSKSLNRGDEYDLPNVLALFITEKPLPVFEGFDGFFHTVQLRSLDGKIFSEKIMLGYLDLSKFAAQLETLDMSDERNRILYMFTNVVYLQKDEVNTLTPMQMRFYEECQINNFTDMEKQDYVKSLMEYPSVQEMVDCERADAKEEGIQIGIQMGIEQGIEQGIKQGIEQGIEQGIKQERFNLARNMLAKGLDPAFVAELSGLTESEVHAMAREAGQ